MLSLSRDKLLSGAGSRPPDHGRVSGKERFRMASKPQFGFALEYVSDIETVKRFYVDVLGLTVEREHPTFIQFSGNFAIASDESMTGSRETELYWLIDDADATYAELSGKAEIS